jgi:integrase
VLRNVDGTPMRDAQTSHATYRICRRAKLEERGWHVLRHAFGTHAALFGVNPWVLMGWMGHKRIDETMLYVNVANAHRRPIPADVLQAGAQIPDPNDRIVAMLGTRGKTVAKKKAGFATGLNHS